MVIARSCSPVQASCSEIAIAIAPRPAPMPQFTLTLPTVLVAAVPCVGRKSRSIDSASGAGSASPGLSTAVARSLGMSSQVDLWMEVAHASHPDSRCRS
jgi:hypothetical protein